MEFNSPASREDDSVFDATASRTYDGPTNRTKPVDFSPGEAVATVLLRSHGNKVF